MKRLVKAAVLAGVMGLGFSLDAHAQALIMPTGPLSVKPIEATPTLARVDAEQIYPGRTMGGGTRILRSSPPPSYLNRRRED